MNRTIIIIAILAMGWNLAAQPTILQENFDVLPFEGWTTYQDNIGSNWGQCWQSDCGHNEGFSAHHFLCNGGCNKWLITPQLKVSTANTQLTFWERFDENAIQYYEYSGVGISTSSGIPDDGDFIEIFTNDPSSLPTSWVQRTIDLSAYEGQDVYISFHFNGTWHEWFVDDVTFGPPTFTDVGINKFLNPLGTNPDTGIEDVQLTIENFGTENIDEFTVNWWVNGIPQSSYSNLSAEFMAGSTIDETIGQYNFDTPGDYEIMASIQVSDDFNANNNDARTIYYVTTEKDAAILNIQPNGYTPTIGIHDVIVEVFNPGEETIEDFSVVWQVNGSEQPIYEGTSLGLESGQTTSVTIGQYDFPQGIHEITADINASGEVNPDNDFRTDFVSVNTFWESFEGTQYPPEGWSVDWGLHDNFFPPVHGTRYHHANTDNNIFGLVVDTLYTPALEVMPGDQLSFYREWSSFFPSTLSLVWKDSFTGTVTVLESSISEGSNIWEQVVRSLFPPTAIGQIGFAFSSNSFGAQSIDLITSEAKVYQWPVDLSIKDLEMDYLARSGVTNELSVKVKNLGQTAVTGLDYMVRIKNSEGTELLSMAGIDLDIYEEASFDFEYEFPDLGAYILSAEVVIDDDFTANNESRERKIHSVPADVVLREIGKPDFSALNFPFDFGGDANSFSKTDLSQSLFFSNEIDTTGYIYGMTYYTRNIYSNHQKLPLQTWISSTDKVDFSDGWTPIDELSIISEDTLEVRPGVYEPLYIPFDTPILYSNLKNLVIQHYLTNSEWPPAFGGVWASDANGPDRVVSLMNSLEAYPDNAPDFYGSSSDHAYTTFVVQPIAQLASISGTVFDEADDPLESVSITVNGQPITASTDIGGNYALSALPYAEYTITASLFGYDDDVKTIDADQTDIQLDFHLSSKPKIQINADVVGSNDPAIPLDQVRVSTVGYEELETVSAADGLVLFEDVFGNAEYHITFSKYGYHDSTITVNVLETDYDLGTIELQQEFISPHNVSASPESNLVNVQWLDPVTSRKERFQTDLDVTWFSYTNEPNENVWLGNLFENDEPLTLQSVEVFWDIYLLDVGLVTMEILDENGDVVASSIPFETARDTLMTIDVPNVTMTGDFYVMVHWQDNPVNTHALRVDRTPGITNNAYIKYPGQSPELLSDFLGVVDGSFLVRAEVLKGSATMGNSPLHYNIYSGDPTDMVNVASWEQLNTNPISILEYQDTPQMSGPVMYAVEAVYQEGVSEPSFSNRVDFIVGVDDIENMIGLSIYPNPNDGVFNVELKMTREDVVNFRIFDSMGREILTLPEQTLANYRSTIDMNDASPGLYMIEIAVGNKRMTQKFILK